MTSLICPQTDQEISAAVLSCKTHKIIPAGNLSALRHRLNLENTGLKIISSQNMLNLDIEPENLMAVAQAGLTPKAINEALSPLNLYWPVSGISQRSLGAIMAEGLLGAEAMSHGTMCDWILGGSFVTASGDIIRSGGRTLKNVSGYHLNALLWRACGQLGISGGFILKLKPKPQTAPLIQMHFPQIRMAVKVARALITLQFQADAIQIELQGRQAVLRTWFSGFKELTSFKMKRLYDLAPDIQTDVYENGFDFWDNKNKLLESAGALKISGGRNSLLNFLQKIADNSWQQKIKKAEFDIGSGKAAIVWNSADDAPALEEGLESDKINLSGDLYKKIKEKIDPENIFSFS